MKDVQVFSLYSGSSGNSFLVRTPEGAILIDAGKNAKKLCLALEECGTSPDEIRAVFVTHEHADHISALPVFLKKHPIPVHILEKSAPALCKDPAASPLICVHRPIYTEEVCGIKVTSFPTPHDSMASVGYRMEIPRADGSLFRIGYATDIGYVSSSVEEGLCGCDAVILESNHDTELLETGPYPQQLKRRIASRYGHLSNADSAAFAARLCRSGTRALMLAHLSRENNTPDTAYAECIGAVGDDRVRICIAMPDSAVKLDMEDLM